jgi:hypothetical protein
MPSTDSRILFVYYKVDLAQADAALPSIHAALDDVARATGIRGRLMRRTDDASTWMEVYDPVQDLPALDAALAEAVARHGLERFLKPGTRRMNERFQPHG